MNVTNRFWREGICDFPTQSIVIGTVNMNFIALRVVEVLSPVNKAAWRACYMQGTSASSNNMRDLETLFTGRARHDSAGNSADHGSR
jgi:hypothetical protein